MSLPAPVKPTRRLSVTQKDVARVAGVTQATVSLVINNSKRINGATRTRVEKAIAELGYVTNPLARSLATCNTNVLSLLTPNLRADSEQFMMALMQGLLEGLGEEDYVLNYCHGRAGQAAIDTVKREVTRNRAAGMFILSPYHEEADCLQYLLDQDVPFVLVNRLHENHKIACVAVDYADIAYRAISYLHRKGHRRIGFINGSPERPSSQARLRGVRMAFLELDLEISENLFVQGNFQIDGGYQGTKKLLSIANPPTAIFAGNDLQGFGAVQALNEKGMKVPEDIAVIGCDDLKMASWIRPPLTTLRVPFHEMGVIAANNLMKQVRGENLPVRQVVLPCQLIEREST